MWSVKMRRHLGLVPLVILLAGCDSGGLTHRASPSEVGCPKCSQTARDLVWSLDNEPKAWSNDGFTLCKGWDKPCVWFSNGTFGLEAGNNSLGSGWHPQGNDTEFVWNAIQRWLEKDLATR